MVEVSELGLKEEETELDLGLSIGRNFKKPENPKQPPDLKPNGFDPDLNEQHQNQALPGIACERQREGAVMNHQTKREIHALRRREAKKKRELKRAMRESEPDDQRAPKREKTDHPNGGSELRNAMNLNLSNEQDVGRTSCSGPTVSFRTSSEQVGGGTRGGGLTASFPMAQVQYVALNNGFALPCMVPCWAQSVNEMEKNSVGQNGVACRGFQPYNGNELEQNAERDRKAKSNGSSMCGSSMMPENRSPSQDGGSTDSRSHSAYSSANPTQLNSFKESNSTSQPQQSASSHPNVSENGTVTKTNHTMKDLQQNMIQPNPTKHKSTTNHIVKDLQQNLVQPNSSKLNATAENKSSPIHMPLPKENPCNMPLKETKTDAVKPPKPLSQSMLLPQMPYVTTTGNGPNGKTVNGFLYRYSKSEVSIICVCHGSTFSPAEFVQHAGGTDVSQPLRHITVMPSAFG